VCFSLYRQRDASFPGSIPTALLIISAPNNDLHSSFVLYVYYSQAKARLYPFPHTFSPLLATFIEVPGKSTDHYHKLE